MTIKTELAIDFSFKEKEALEIVRKIFSTLCEYEYQLDLNSICDDVVTDIDTLMSM